MASSSDLSHGQGKVNDTREHMLPAVESTVAYRLILDSRDGEKIVHGIGLEVTAFDDSIGDTPNTTIDTYTYTASVS
jgi:hypothetical protein